MNHCYGAPGSEIMQKPLRGIHYLNTIKQLKSRFPDTSFVAVEGPKDIEVFKRFINGKNCQLYPICNKDKICEMVKEPIFKSDPDIIAIRDVDYLRVNKKMPKYDKLFFTDNNDMETEIIRSESFINFLNNLDLPDAENIKIRKNKLRDHILEHYKMIGLLRCYNDKKKLGIPFKKLEEKFQDYFVAESMSLNFDEYINDLRSIPETYTNELNDIDVLKHNLHVLENLIKNENFDKNSNYLWNFCRGHDLTQFLFLILSKRYKIEFKNNSVNTNKEFESKLYESYKWDNFRKTELFNSIMEWQTENHQRNIFRDIN
jgi:hypothetical protein